MRVLAKHPRLALVLAHMGAPEVEDFLALAEHYDNVRLDTTMVFTDFFPPYPRELLPRLADLGHKILLGTDFPTIPYPYAHQLESLARLDLGDDWLRAVCWENGARAGRMEPGCSASLGERLPGQRPNHRARSSPAPGRPPADR